MDHAYAILRNITVSRDRKSRAKKIDLHFHCGANDTEDPGSVRRLVKHVFEIFSFWQQHCDESCHPKAPQENLTRDSNSKIAVHVCQATTTDNPEGMRLEPDEVKEGSKEEQTKTSGDHCSAGSVSGFNRVVSDQLTA